jgi:hypothetical protein
MYPERRVVVMKGLAGAEGNLPGGTLVVLRKVVTAVAGVAVLLFGVALLVVPVPGTSVVVLPLGLAVLAREFQWARRLLVWLTAMVARVWAGVRRLFGKKRLAVIPVLALTAAWDDRAATRPAG